VSRTIVELHLLQTVPPSNVNRDDTGSPKTAMFGGTRRARVSSQAWKRATRLAFDDLLDRRDLGVRTKRVVEFVEDAILDKRPDLRETAYDLAASIATSTGLKLNKSKRKRADETPHEETGYLVFLSRLQIDRLAEAALEAAPDGDPAALKGYKGKALLDTGHSIDLALFGRMVADVSDLNVDASAQVAHAISVHGVENEFDYFTAVDDAKREEDDDDDEEDAGAAMIGTVEFNSSTLYRYATVDANRLYDNLGDAEATRRGVEAFVQAFVESMPTGKQNTFANRTLPEAVLITVRDSMPINLVGAFEIPVVADATGSRAAAASRALITRATEVSTELGQRPVASWVIAVGSAKEAMLGSTDGSLDWVWTTLPDLSGQVGALVDARLRSE